MSHPTVKLSETVAQLAKDLERGTNDDAFNAVNAEIQRRLESVRVHLAAVRDDLLITRTLALTDNFLMMDPSIIERALLEMAALVHTFPNYPEDIEARRYLGTQCVACGSAIIDVEKKRPGKDRLLICERGHRTLPTPDNQ